MPFAGGGGGFCVAVGGEEGNAEQVGRQSTERRFGCGSWRREGGVLRHCGIGNRRG